MAAVHGICIQADTTHTHTRKDVCYYPNAVTPKLFFSRMSAVREKKSSCVCFDGNIDQKLYIAWDSSASP